MIESRSIRNQAGNLPRFKSRLSRIRKKSEKNEPAPVMALGTVGKKQNPLETSEDLDFVALSSGLGFEAKASLENHGFNPKAEPVTEMDHQRIVPKKAPSKGSAIEVGSLLKSITSVHLKTPTETEIDSTFSNPEFMESSSAPPGPEVIEQPVERSAPMSLPFETMNKGIQPDLKTQASVITQTPVRETVWASTSRLVRVSAFLLDSILVIGVSALFFLMGVSVASNPELIRWLADFKGASSWTWLKTALLAFSYLSILFFVYFTVCETLIGRSLGKWTFRINVISNTNQLGKRNSIFRIILRNIGFLLGILTGGLGLLWTFVDDRKRCWHDVMSGTEVCEPEIHEVQMNTDPFPA